VLFFLVSDAGQSNYSGDSKLGFAIMSLLASCRIRDVDARRVSESECRNRYGALLGPRSDKVTSRDLAPITVWVPSKITTWILAGIIVEAAKQQIWPR